MDNTDCIISNHIDLSYCEFHGILRTFGLEEARGRSANWAEAA
jgi:hypothetical protein